MAVSIEQRPLAVSSRRGSPRPSVSVVLRYILITVLAILVFMPFILSFLGTFKTNPEVTAYPPTFLPREWHPENWAQTWSVEISGAGQYVFARWFFNSFWLAVVNMVTQLFFCSLAAYAFARMRFPGKDLIFAFIIASMAIPGAVTLIPGYVFFAKLGWINTYWPLIVPKLVVPFGIFMLTQFFKSIPRELEEAAYIDGASRFRTYWNVAMPLSRPALITLAIIQFQGSWNDFLGPLLYLRDAKLLTLTVGLNFFKTQYAVEWNKILVGSMFNAIPILIIFFIFNKYYMEGASYSGLAGQ
ncbi:MAG: carbohydrate ABC transporter permease [Chloroflexi bacterium SZAS-1]|jgi:multiple sugar transport system permease protein|nr:carbohydrate ABC transporter permease [Chloroflexi bacterium SZAS-1]HNP86267.1 carbohydrate ABC transporter permease [Kouleothrix sp.]